MLGARDVVLDVMDRPLNEELFIKAHTGGAGGDGTIRELPPEILSAVKRSFNATNEMNARWPDNPENQDWRTRGRLSLYPNMSGSVQAGTSLGTVGLYFDQQGNAVIKDDWKVDNPDKRVQILGGKPLIKDLVEGGELATDIHDMARLFGTYRNMPIEVKLTKEQWEAIDPDAIGNDAMDGGAYYMNYKDNKR